MERTLKIFILDSGAKPFFPDTSKIGLQVLLENIAKEEEIPTTIRFSRKKDVKSLPRDYDGYFIHLSDAFRESVIDLREKQSWSKVYGLRGGGQSSEYQEYFDSVYHHFTMWDARKALREIKEIYSKD